MPTRPRIDLAGFHHVINRGVNRCNVFNHSDDKDMFLQIVNKAATVNKVVLHDYCLMDNHYHILIETKDENLASFMRIVNANYAKYFNKKYNRSGHLWQDRYKSRYITSENYLYTLIKYIENNPLEASICNKISQYPYTLSYLIFNDQVYYPCCSESILFKEFDINTLNDFLGEPINDKELKYLQEKEKVYKEDNVVKFKQSKHFDEHFDDVLTKQDRNIAILNAYDDGYPQIEIAKYLNVSTSLISKVIKNGYSTPGV